MPRDTPGLSLTQSVYEQLRADLLACRLWPGDRLKISDLCQSMGVNLGAVREALSRLSSEGLVVAEPQRGFRVAPISATELRDLTEVRIEVEARCLRRSIEVADVRWETAIVAAHHGLTRLPERDPDDPSRANDAWSAQHAAFHRALVAGCGSPWLLRLRDSLYDQSERYRRLSVPLGRAEREVGREHREIMEAAVSRQADRACALLAEHFRATTLILLEVDALGEDT
ncbi:FCD domain-containing protein [Roseomonas sp. KE2513]|uniref:GntR family transcriptional regulator n=1 Tax=Roseomonas sp. KE2513 TaxID=2479202 RepID=UPI0018DF753A|nr:FCD domain-containing protein [Roseomonas sp. KE2513]MBI0537845.1 FCD domain-containing protein [Roseomonas sp. KE2513]